MHPMDDALRKRIENHLRPLYAELDGASRFDEMERVGRIARRLTTPTRELELLILFHPLGGWLDRLGNQSRTQLAFGGAISETDLRRTAQSIKRLEQPVTDGERAVAAAIFVDRCGLRGLAERLARARREGSSVTEVAAAAAALPEMPAWMPVQAIVWATSRAQARIDFCRRLLAESDLADLGPDR